VAELARVLPVVAVHPDSHELVAGAPSARRRLLDQGLFHVEPSFHPTWQRYRRALAQRNAVLRAGGAERELAAWEPELAEAGARMDALRRSYVADLNAVVRQRLPALLGEAVDLVLHYRPGWSGEETDFGAALGRARGRDREQSTRDSRQRVSRGQQKLLVYLLRLGQAEQLARATGEGCVLLLDDLAAELDSGYRRRVLELALDVGAQIFVTALEPEVIPRDAIGSLSVFHVEQGEVREVIQ